MFSPAFKLCLIALKQCYRGYKNTSTYTLTTSVCAKYLAMCVQSTWTHVYRRPSILKGELAVSRLVPHRPAFALLTSLKENLLQELCLACRDGRRFADAIDKLEKHERAFHHEADLTSARHVKDIHTAVSGRAPNLMAPANSQSSIHEQHT